MNPLSKADADRQAERAQAIIECVSPLFDGQQPGVIGSVLAELMARFLCCHKIPSDAAREADLRATLLRHWCETVWSLTALNEGGSETKQ